MKKMRHNSSTLAGLFSVDASIGALDCSDCMHDYVEEQHLKKFPIDFLLQKCAVSK